MNRIPAKQVQICNQALTAAGTECGSGVTNYIDTLGFAYAVIDVITQTTTGTMSTLAIYEADATTSTSFAAIVALTGGTVTSTSAGFVIGTSPTAAQTSRAYVNSFNVDLRGRKRYLKAVVIPNSACTLTAIANLFKSQEQPYTAAKAMAATVVSG